MPAALGAVVSAASIGLVLVAPRVALTFGVPWLVVGVAALRPYRRSTASRSSSASRCRSTALPASALEVEYGSILVPVLGTPLDDDIMQTAGRLAGDEHEEYGEDGATIEALWVFEVPMALPIDGGCPRASSSARGRR